MNFGIHEPHEIYESPKREPKPAPANALGLIPSTLRTCDQAVAMLDDPYNPVFGRERRQVEEYAQLLNHAEIVQQQAKARYLNPKAAGRDAAWIEIQQLIEDRSYATVPEETRKRIAELEAELTQKGVLE